ncbi:winged helix-turn-helix domain-containing protein [Streptomyces sp. NPDC002573]|uniref:winged helix-turn-helix domain-containing protein n=1 Tax=Streptomyces sp. NPDC002573 TaxID=3364651 RepID=UPI0036D20348
MHRTGYSVQMPARPAVERDEDAITAWREVTWQEVNLPVGDRRRHPLQGETVMTGRPLKGLLATCSLWQ